MSCKAETSDACKKHVASTLNVWRDKIQEEYGSTELDAIPVNCTDLRLGYAGIQQLDTTCHLAYKNSAYMTKYHAPNTSTPDDPEKWFETAVALHMVTGSARNCSSRTLIQVG